jgi:bifunctional non-homologous end joining protein LigD
MSLDEYSKKRDLNKSPEPGAKARESGKVLRFVVQKHAASHLHYDFRLELDGVLKSWAVPKGPSLDPALKRLAMMVEDHPYDYRTFEGTIPKGNYGAGEVIVWDEGTYHSPGVTDTRESEKLLRAGLYKGDLKFILEGHKLNGEFALVKIKADKDNSWLLIKKKDQWASADDVTRDDRSVLSDATLHDPEAHGRGKGHGRVKSSSEPVAAGPDAGSYSAPAAAGKSATTSGRPAAAGQRPVTPGNSPAEGQSATMPHDLKPMLATLIEEPFDDPDWIFEIKQDGYRAIAELQGGAVQLYSRNNLSFNRQFARVVDSLSSLRVDAVFDGELVALDEKGRSYFQLLQNHLRGGGGEITYFLFDLLYLNGKDLRALPLIRRKELLRDLLPELPDIRFSDHIARYGKDFFELARSNSLEGIIAKRADSPYQAGRRSKDWLKIKIRLQQEAIICGYTEPRGSRKLFGSLVLGAYHDGELIPIGFSGGGFDDRLLKEIHGKLQDLVQAESPFKVKVKADMGITWVRPVLVCEVSFSEWTDEKSLRQPVFLGLREDKDPATVVREIASEVAAEPESPEATAQPSAGSAQPAGKAKDQEITIGGHKLKLSNLNKVFWPDQGYTKGDVISFYRQMAAFILPHLKDRPESLYRTPNGIVEKGFFQKESGELPPQWMATKEIYSESNKKNIRYFICQDEATLVYLANLGCIEINPWLSRLQQLDYPDYFVIDLDPEDIPFDKVVEAAQAVHEVLERAGATGYPKTSGATGIHIYVPLGAKYDYETAGKFAQVVATLVHQEVPGFTSLIRDPRKRQQRVYLDFLQNRAGQTLAAPYSIRPRPGATVSAPLTWEEVRLGLDPQEFTIKTMASRVERLGDLFLGVLGPGIDLEKCLDRLQ